MARFLKPLVRSGGYYPSRRWTPLVYPGGYTTANGGGEPEPPPIEKTITGNPIHILDAIAKPAQALSIALEPIQDLNGYDNPWPAGGGKQLYNSATFSTITNGTITCTNNGDGSFTLNADEADTVDRFFDIFNQFTESAGGTPLPSAEYRLTGTPSGGGDTYTMYVRPSYSKDTGNGVTFTNSVIGGSILIKAGYRPQNLVFRPMIRLASNGDDTFAPYSNICPIYGHTDADVTRTGKNLLDFSVRSLNGITTTKVNGYAHIEGTASATTYPVDGIATTLYAGTYVWSVSGLKEGLTGTITKDGSWGGNLTQGTVMTLAKTTQVGFYVKADSGAVTNTDVKVMLEKASTATDWEPYVGTTYPIPLGQTVYGGQLDVVTGVLTVDRAIWTKNTADMDNADDTPGWRNSGIKDLIGSGVNAEFSNQIMNIGKYFSANTNGSNDILFLRTARYNKTQTEWIALAIDVQIVVDLATPITIQLTPQQVELLLGENNIWSDGEMTLVYLADGNASDEEALNILLGGRYVNNHSEDEPTDREALDILLGR